MSILCGEGVEGSTIDILRIGNQHFTVRMNCQLAIVDPWVDGGGQGQSA